MPTEQTHQNTITKDQIKEFLRGGEEENVIWKFVEISEDNDPDHVDLYKELDTAIHAFWDRLMEEEDDRSVKVADQTEWGCQFEIWKNDSVALLDSKGFERFLVCSDTLG